MEKHYLSGNIIINYANFRVLDYSVLSLCPNSPSLLVLEPASLRVARGAAWLDEVRPGWDEIIDLDTLNISSPFSCVCGQVWEQKGEWAPSGYTYAMSRYGMDEPTIIARGFGTYSSDYPVLLEAWRAFITARRQAKASLIQEAIDIFSSPALVEV